MSISNFCIRVNLSMFYDDVRRFSWVYVDLGNICHIDDLKQHIARLCDIQTPFHLLLNNTDYLWPEEDVRTLKDNCTVVAMPGSGLKENAETQVNQSATGSNVTEDQGTEKTPLKNKRKRIRQQKNSNSNTQLSAINEVVEVSATKKPRMVSSLMIPRGKYIRFGNVDGEQSTSKDEVESERAVEATENNRNGEACGGTTVSGEKSENEAASYALTACLKIDPQVLPIMLVKAAVRDVIAFKMLKVSRNDTPEVSNFIIVETIQCCPETWTYTFKVLAGKDQVQTLQGKLDVQLDENEVSETSDTIVLQWTQLIEPRLICSYVQKVMFLIDACSSFRGTRPALLI